MLRLQAPGEEYGVPISCSSWKPPVFFGPRAPLHSQPLPLRTHVISESDPSTPSAIPERPRRLPSSEARGSAQSSPPQCLHHLFPLKHPNRKHVTSKVKRNGTTTFPDPNRKPSQGRPGQAEPSSGGGPTRSGPKESRGSFSGQRATPTLSSQPCPLQWGWLAPCLSLQTVKSLPAELKASSQPLSSSHSMCYEMLAP